MIALESLSEFNVLIRSQQPNMTVSVTAGPQVKQFTVNTLNALVLQAAEVRSLSDIWLSNRKRKVFLNSEEIKKESS